METVEEGQIRIEFLKLVDEVEEDRISALPDWLPVEILSRLPSTKYAIRTGTLSKRWKHLWTWVHTLIFTNEDTLLTKYPQNPIPISDFVSFVDKTLTQCRQLKLKKFEVHTIFGYTSYDNRFQSQCNNWIRYDFDTSYDIRFESQFNNWIRYAVSCNVEELNLEINYMVEPEILLDQIIFVSSCFTDLTLGGCILNPSGAISWKNLRNLCMSYLIITEDLMENILSGSPLLETLVLHCCYGYRRLDITSKSVKNLVFDGYRDLEDQDYVEDIIEINAPNILSLSIVGDLMLWKILLLNMSSLIQANINFDMFSNSEPTKKEAREELLKGFILNLRHVKELEIGSSCSRAVSRLEAKGFTLPSNVNVKFPDGRSDWSDSDSDSEW